MVTSCRKEELYRTVFHEIGHYAVIRSLELPVELIYIEVTDDDSVGYCQQPKGSTLDDFDEGVVKIAGEVAENLYLPPSPEDLSEIRWSKDREELEA